MFDDALVRAEQEPTLGPDLLRSARCLLRPEADEDIADRPHFQDDIRAGAVLPLALPEKHPPLRDVHPADLDYDLAHSDGYRASPLLGGREVDAVMGGIVTVEDVGPGADELSPWPPDHEAGSSCSLPSCIRRSCSALVSACCIAARVCLRARVKAAAVNTYAPKATINAAQSGRSSMSDYPFGIVSPTLIWRYPIPTVRGPFYLEVPEGAAGTGVDERYVGSLMSELVGQLYRGQ